MVAIAVDPTENEQLNLDIKTTDSSSQSTGQILQTKPELNDKRILDFNRPQAGGYLFCSVSA